MIASQPANETLGSRLSKLIEPLPLREFLETYWRKSYLHVRGASNRFSTLLPWEQLNCLISQHRLEPPRLNLFRAGKVVKATEFIDYEERAGSRVPRISAKRLSREIRHGATMLLAEVHSLYEPLTDLAEGLERLFGVPVGINAYAAFGTSNGLPAHCDDHDVIVLQVSGRKRWLLYGASDPHELHESEVPTNVIWNEILCQGDFLYVPRGWWHMVVPLNEPSIHLTISISNPTVKEVLSWIVEELGRSEIGHSDVSPLSDVAEKEHFIETMKQVMLGKLSRDVLDRYFRDSDSTRRALTHLSLPWSAVSPQLLASDDTSYQLTARRTLNLNDTEQFGIVEFSCNQSRWRFPAAMRFVLEALNDGHCHSVSELVTLGGRGLDEATLRAFLSIFLAEGLVVIVPRERPGLGTQV